MFIKETDMITFGYKNRFNGPIRALTAIAIGLVMVISKANALNIAVRVIAAFLIASGVVSMLVGYKNRSEGTMGLMGFNAAVDVFLGCVLFIWPGAVSGLLIFIIGAALFGFGLFQLVALFSANRVMKVGAFSFVMPSVVLFCGLFLIARPSFVGEAIGVVAGIAIIVYGASELLSSWKIMKAIDESQSSVNDVIYTKVEDDNVDEQ